MGSNRSGKDKEIVNLNCSICNAPIMIKYGTYRCTKNQPHYCRECRGKNESNRIKNLSEDERISYLNKKNKAISAGWKKQTKEQKEAISKQRKEYHATPERKAFDIQNGHNKWNKMSEEERKLNIYQMNKGKEIYWSKKENVEYHSNRARVKWFKQSEEEQEKILSALTKGRIDYYENLSKNNRMLLNNKISTGNQNYWNNLTDEEYLERIRNFQEGIQNNASEEKLYKSELEFLNYLNIYKILDYELQYLNKIEHPDFRKLFPINPCTPNRKISAFHRWDFKINFKNKSILVDVDGSSHDYHKTNYIITDAVGNRYNMAEYNKFNDSKRPYQTDGLDAYIIRCYDDTLGPNNEVINIKTNHTMLFSSFLNFLSFENMDNKEINKMFKSLRKNKNK